MIKLFASLIRQLLFWLVFFALNRAVFLVYYHKLVSMEEPGFGEILSGFWHALRLDVSTASYILIIPFFLLLLRSLLPLRIFDYANKVFAFLVIVAYNLITTAELGIYAEWKTKLHYKALHYLGNPDEVYNSADSSTFIWLVIIFILLTGLTFMAYHRFVYHKSLQVRRSYIGSLLFLLITPVLLFLGIRGGIQEIPINQSQSFYSKHNILNLAAVNSGYSFTFSMMDNLRFMDENPFEFYPDEEARRIVDELNYVEKDTTIHVLTTTRPNIVILLLESWSADLIHSLGGEEGITPEFEKLAEDGLLFTSMYASGNRSEQAMSSIFGGFPATPITAITHNLDKVVHLPSFPELLKKEGYHTSFYFGGHLMYGGIKSYLSIAGFDEMTEIYDLPDSLPRGKLGVHDEYLFSYQLNELKDITPPFLSVVFSLSTHSPYDQPMEEVLDWGGSEKQYINSAYYTDQCLRDYFEEAKQQEWYDSTLFIILADHSHNSYRHWDVHSPNYRHIPMLFYGNVIKQEYKGKQIDQMASQVDVPVTLLEQMHINHDKFYWSRNILNPYTQDFIFYETNNGFGWIRPDAYLVWYKDIGYINFVSPEEKKEQYEREARAYLQTLFREFIDF